MPDLPPDVRDRAARAAQLSDAGGSWIPVWDSFHDENREYWRAIVDAVAEVLAAEQRDNEDLMERVGNRMVQTRIERDALKARVAELEDANAELRAHGPIEVDGATYQCGWERAYMRHVTVADGRTADAEARVDLLTTALTRLDDAISSDIDDIPDAQRAARKALPAGEVKPDA